MASRHPLAFLLGPEGVALLRAFAGDRFDREFVDARIAENRALLEHAAPELGEGAEAGQVSTADGPPTPAPQRQSSGTSSTPAEIRFTSEPRARETLLVRPARN